MTVVCITGSCYCGRGAVWYRLVGVNLTESSIRQDAEEAVRFITQRLNLDILFGTFVQVAAPNTSVSARERTVISQCCVPLSCLQPCTAKCLDLYKQIYSPVQVLI